MVGRGTRVPWSIEVSPPPTQGSGSSPRRRSRRRRAWRWPPARRPAASRAATAARRRRRRSPRRSAGQHHRHRPGRSAGRRRSPDGGEGAGTARSRPMPVITVIDRKIVPMITAWVTRNSHESSARVNTTTPVIARKPAPKIRVARSMPGCGRARRGSAGVGRPGERVGLLAGGPQRGPQDQQTEQHDERHRRGDVLLDPGEQRVVVRPAGRKVLAGPMSIPSPMPPAKAPGRLTRRPTASGRDHHHHEVEEVGGGEGVEARDQHARQPGEQARQRPEGGDPVGADAGTARSCGALDDRPHRQAEVGVAEQPGQGCRP